MSPGAHAHLINLVDKELLPGVVLDQLHGGQQLLEVGTALLSVGCILLLGLDDEIAKQVLQGHDDKDDAPAGQGPLLDQDDQDGQNGTGLNGGSPQVVDVLDAVKDLQGSGHATRSGEELNERGKQQLGPVGTLESGSRQGQLKVEASPWKCQRQRRTRHQTPSPW
jgi:hypothetical protein